MGLLDAFRQPKTPIVQTILPVAAQQEIMCGRLPILNTNKIFLKNGEKCHYVDKAIYEKKLCASAMSEEILGILCPVFLREQE